MKGNYALLYNKNYLKKNFIYFLFRDISMETPLDYISIYKSEFSLKKILEILDEKFLLNLLFDKDMKFLQKIFE
jgi:hypothetical protein